MSSKTDGRLNLLIHFSSLDFYPTSREETKFCINTLVDRDSDKSGPKKRLEKKPSIKRDSVKRNASSHTFAEIDKMKVSQSHDTIDNSNSQVEYKTIETVL